MKNEPERHRGQAITLGFSAIAVLAYVLLLIPLARQAAGWYFFTAGSKDGLLKAAQYDSGSETYAYLLGRYFQADIRQPDTGKAIAHYRRSIALNPLQAGAWADLSRAYRLSGSSREAEHALERAVDLSPNNPDLLWEAGTFWIMDNMTDKAFAAFRKYLVAEPDNQAMLYDLAWKVKPDNAYILKNLVPETYDYRSKYLAYLISAKKADEARETWKTLDHAGMQKNDFISYVNFLISNGIYDEAGSVWKEITGKVEGMVREDAASLLWNHSFENEPMNGGFDWRIRETEGVNVFIDDGVHMTGKRSLGVLFDGKHNPDIAFASQVVRVLPKGQYTLRAQIKTDGLTTANGVFLQVSGHNCTGPDRRSDMVTGTSFWKEVTIEFEAPASCNAIVVMARRERSNKLDNKIEGTAWIDGITLRQQTSVQTSSSEKP